MSTKQLKYLVNKLEKLVESRANVTEFNHQDSIEYMRNKEKILENIIETAKSMYSFNRSFPDRHEENFKERQALVDSQ